MKVRKHRLSLAVGILLAAAGGLYTLFALFGSGIELSAAISGIIGTAASYAGIGSGINALLPLSVIAFISGAIILLFRRKKRFTMFLSVPFIFIIYATVMVFCHHRDGNPEPAVLVSSIPDGRAWLVIVCAVLEALLFMILLSVSGRIDRRIRDREEKRSRRLKLEEEMDVPSVSDDASSPDDSYDDPEPIQRSPEEEKADRRYMKMKARMDRKTERKEARLAAKDEKKFQKYQAKEEKKARKLAEKEEKAAAKALRKENRKAVPADDDVAEEFLTSTPVSAPRRQIDPSARVDVPEVGDIPHLKQFGDAQPHPASAADDMPPVSDVFMQVRDEIEREEAEKVQPEPEYHDPAAGSSFTKGGMLEAAIETMREMNAKPDKGVTPSSPIIGYDDDARKPEKVRKNNSSFAPSGLSPEHPRYKLFEALAGKKGVSSFPARSFEAEAPEGGESGYKSTFVKKKAVPESSWSGDAAASVEEAEAVPERKIPGLSPDFLKASADMAESAVSAEVQEPKRRKAAPEPAAEEEAVQDPFEELQREEAEKKALRQAAMKQKAEEEAAGGADDDEGGRDMPAQENELQLSVGIGGLQSNELGYAAITQRSRKKYTAPPLNILKDYPHTSSEIDDFTRQQGNRIIDTFAEFHVNITLDSITKGPTVTMYQLKLGEGVPVARVTSRENELSYNLGGVRIRILAPVPGRQAVGIEVPNKTRAIIGFKDMLNAFRRSDDSTKLRVPMILGRTITGEPVTIDVAKMPHMLIAGTTGSGKSVCINSFICTLIYSKSPQEVRLIMVDPKVVELTVYNGVPHLLTPVITEPKKVVKALGWLCDEMERRYQMISKFGVRNIEGLNAKIVNENIPAEKLPYIVLIMDEFADLMSTVGKDIETYVARLAAKARAAGIHLILATQRPSADVITGTIKNNFPARIAFAVSSGTNSRIILDEGGAENLLGKGDMLLMEPSTMGFQRIQGAFLSDDEVYSIVGFAAKHGTPDYLSEDIFEEPEVHEDEGDDAPVSDEDSDEVLYERAKQIVFERKCASASYLQRRMKIGYNRAARMIEMMEENGIIGPPNGSKPREILKYE